MTSTVTSFQNSAQIALKLLSSGAAAGQAQAPGGAANATKATPGGAGPSGATRIVLSAKAATDYFGAGSDIARVFSGVGDTVEVTYSGLDVPEDKTAFRRQVLDFLQSYAAGFDARYPEHAEFMQALKDGKVIVKTVDETPELNWQPDVGWAVYRDGYPQGGGITSKPIGNQELLDAQETSRSQNIGQIGGHYFYAYFER